MLAAPAPLTVRGVFKALHAVSAEEGKGAAGRRKATILRLLRSCRCGAPLAGLPVCTVWMTSTHMQSC